MLLDHFERCFKLLPVRDAAAREAVLRLRFAVYCEELGYENCDAFPDGLERDRFDDGHAVYALLQHRTSGAYAACVRLIVDLGDDGDFRFPFEVVCRDRLNPALAALSPAQRRRSGEISRLAIHRDFRRRHGEWNSPEGVGDGAGVPVAGDRRQPLLPASLFLAAAALALNRQLDQAFVMMEPRLARLLARSGIHFTQVGEVVDHHGQRGPFSIDREALERGLPAEAQDLLAAMRDALR